MCTKTLLELLPGNGEGEEETGNLTRGSKGREKLWRGRLSGGVGRWRRHSAAAVLW
jgi:hypothetical protein